MVSKSSMYTYISCLQSKGEHLPFYLRFLFVCTTGEKVFTNMKMMLPALNLTIKYICIFKKEEGKKENK